MALSWAKMSKFIPLSLSHCRTLRLEDCVQYARYLRLHLHNTEKAREVVSKALEANPKNVKLYLQMLGEAFCTFLLLKFQLFSAYFCRCSSISNFVWYSETQPWYLILFVQTPYLDIKLIDLLLFFTDILLHSEPIDLEAVETLFDKAMEQAGGHHPWIFENIFFHLYSLYPSSFWFRRH